MTEDLTLSDGRVARIELDDATCTVAVTVDGGPLPALQPIDMGLVCLGLQAASARAGQLRAARADRKTRSRVAASGREVLGRALEHEVFVRSAR